MREGGVREGERREGVREDEEEDTYPLTQSTRGCSIL